MVKINTKKKTKKGNENENFELKNIIEGILFVAEKPVSVKELAQISNTLSLKVQKILLELLDEYKNRGLRLIRKGDYFQLVSSPDISKYIGRYLNQELKAQIGQAALEALAIITYKQPITRIEVEKIRGVNCDAIIRTLQIKGLVAETGRKDAPGKPILYGTTFEFLQYLGVERLEDLPKVDQEKEDKIKHTFKF